MNRVQKLPLPPKAILVHCYFSTHPDDEDVQEFKDLARATGALIITLVVGKRDKPDAKYFIGSGKVKEIAELVSEHKADYVFVNHRLTPGQERNLEIAFKCQVLDRERIILDIFAQRARTFEGKLQVELAQLEHLKTRLIRGWTHLERQRGGIGLRGPGETQLETDRRIIRQRIRHLEARLDKVRTHRAHGRRKRDRADIPTISLIGYTNAGKSTLFNRLSTANTFVADQLFATLDPTLRRLNLPLAGQVILVDTVGFIRHLPTPLITAFRATLEETIYADLLLHVMDIHDPNLQEKYQHVKDVLKQINAENVPELIVCNKIDLVENTSPHLDVDPNGYPERVYVSAQNDLGIDLLLGAMGHCLHPDMLIKHIHLAAEQGKIRAQLYQFGEILAERHHPEGGWEIQVRIAKSHYQRIMHNGHKGV